MAARKQEAAQAALAEERAQAARARAELAARRKDTEIARKAWANVERERAELKERGEREGKVDESTRKEREQNWLWLNGELR